MTQNTNIRGRTLSVQKILVNGSEVTPGGDSVGGRAVTSVIETFTGEIYENSHNMADDDAWRFETSTLMLRSGTILISTKGALVGDSSNQRYPKSAGTPLAVEYVDLSKLYFKNATAGQNTKLNIIGVKM